MELSKEIISEVVKERTSTPPTLLSKDSEVHLSSGLPLAIHILLGHADCKAKDPSRCPSTRQLEVWTLRVVEGFSSTPSSGGGGGVTPHMPPMFLRQAIRSQLHFSPIKSWFSTMRESNPGFRCLYRISTSSHFQQEVDKLEEVGEHQFPPCRVDGRTLLHAQVKWLRKEGFPREVPECPSKRIDDEHWVFPTTTTIPLPISHHLTKGAETQMDIASRKKSLSRQNSREVVGTMAATAQQAPIVGGGGRLTPVVMEKRKKSACGRSPQRKGSNSSLNQVQEHHQQQLEKCPKEAAQEAAQAHLPRPLAKKTPPAGFHPLTRLPLHSSPAPIRRTPRKGLHSEGNSTAGSSSSSSSSESELVGGAELSDEQEEEKWALAMRKRVPSGLLCNFEESALNGRLEPVNQVEGFALQIAVAGTFSSQVTVPCTTSYFKDISEPDQAPSLYLGHCSLEKLRKRVLHIPKKCTLQAVLLNPQGSVVKIFLVNVDVSDMPPRSKTFLRQRTFAVPTTTKLPSTMKTGEKESHKAGTTTTTTLTGQQQPHETSLTDAQHKSALKFLIHLRLASDSKSRVFLHSNVKMLLSNKGNDLEGLETIALETTRLDATTEMPQQPKYSPIK